MSLRLVIFGMGMQACVGGQARPTGVAAVAAGHRLVAVGQGWGIEKLMHSHESADSFRGCRPRQARIGRSRHKVSSWRSRPTP